jgi:HK97 family phage major capsid protein
MTKYQPLHDQLDRRTRQARTRAATAAARAQENSGDRNASVELEQSLADLVHYRQVSDALGSVPPVYRPGARRSFWADVVASSKGDRPAWERLERDAEARALSMLDAGALVVPQYLVDRLGNSGHGRRPLCDLVARPLPAEGATVTIPRISSGVTGSNQTAENSAVTDYDPTSTSETLSVRTVWAAALLSMQALARMEDGAYDLFVARELVGSIDAAQESAVINGSGSSGQPTGLLNVSGIGSVALTSTSVSSFLDAVARAAATSEGSTGRAPDTVVMAPRRWRWLLSNASTSSAAISASEGPGPVSGRVLGLDVVASAGVPTTLSTNQDAVLVVARDELYVGESAASARVQADSQGEADALNSRVEVSRYYATGADRPAGVVKVTGTGLANPFT